MRRGALKRIFRFPDLSPGAGSAATGRLHLADAAPAALEAKFGSDAVSAASLAGAIGIQRMRGEDADADQGEDSC